MSIVTSQDTLVKEAAEVRNVLVDFTDVLDKDNYVNETISSITSIASSPSGVTVSSTSIPTLPRFVEGIEVAPGKCVQFTIASGTNGTDYLLVITVVTSGSQTIVRKIPLEVRSS